MTMTESTTRTLADDRNASPLSSFRARDFGGADGFLCVADGLASDRYSLVPASLVQVSHKNGSTAADLPNGRYSVSKVGADPVNVGDSPDLARLIPDPAGRVELVPMLIPGTWKQAHLVHRDSKSGAPQSTCAVYSIGDGGDLVGIDIDRLEAFTSGASPADVDLPSYFGSDRVIRYSITADPAKVNGPLLVTLSAYRTSTAANTYERTTAVSGTWQAIVMPVKIPTR